MAQEPLATQNLLEAERIERNCIVLKDGGLRSVILVSGMNFELRSEDEQNAALMAYQNFLNGLDFSVQIFIHSRKINIDGYIGELTGIERQETNDLLKGLIGGYKDFVASLVADNPIMEKMFFVVVPYDAALPANQRALFDAIAGFFKRKEIEDPTTIPQTGDAPAETASHAGVGDSSFAALAQRTEQVVSGLSQIGLRAIQLEEDELAELLYNLYNPETVERHVIPQE
jgi:type IV secretory pathway VirB4 component